MEDFVNDEERLRNLVASNFVKFRKNSKLTQAELAEKLQYSDKNISKWERGDALPDVVVLTKLAALYGVSVNDFLTEGWVKNPSTEVEKNGRSKVFNKKQLIIYLLSVGVVWLAATVLFCVFTSFVPAFKAYAWMTFVLAIPASMIVFVVFTSVWCTNLLCAVSVSLLIWSLAFAFNICVPIDKSWLIYIVAIPIQVLDVLWFSLRKINKNARVGKQK